MLKYQMKLEASLQFLDWRSDLDKRRDPRLTETVSGAG